MLQSAAQEKITRRNHYAEPNITKLKTCAMDARRCGPPATSFGLCVGLQTRWWEGVLLLGDAPGGLLQPRFEPEPFVELPHLVAGVPIHIANSLRVGKVHLVDQEDETSSLAEEHSKTQRGLSGEPPHTYRHVCNGSISEQNDDSFSRTVNGGASHAVGWSGPAYSSP